MSPTSYQTAPPRTPILAWCHPIVKSLTDSCRRTRSSPTPNRSGLAPEQSACQPCVCHFAPTVRVASRLRIWFITSEARNGLRSTGKFVLLADGFFLRRQHRARHHDHLHIGHHLLSAAAPVRRRFRRAACNPAVPRSAFALPPASAPRSHSPPRAVPSPIPPSDAPETAAGRGCRPPAVRSDAPAPALPRFRSHAASSDSPSGSISTRTREPGSI